MANESTYAKALTVYLLVQDVLHPLDAVVNDPLPDLHSLNIVPGTEWTLCIRNSSGKRPDWTEFFRQFFDLNSFGFSSSVSALLIVPNGGRYWAITFGRGRSLLREGLIEERFGLRTALNAIDRDKVRAIDKETFDSFASQARQQATDNTEFENFGVDVDRDLLYAVAGAPREAKLGKRLAGKDALCASVKVSLGALSEYLSLVWTVYESGAYKSEGFGWVDNIYEVRDKTSKRNLDSYLVDKLRSSPIQNAWLTVPEILDWQQAPDFSYANPSPPFSIGDVHLSTYLDSFRVRQVPVDIVSIKKSRILCIDQNGDAIHRWNAYRCLYAEISVEDDVFLLTNGHWYKVNRDIVKEVKDWYSELLIETSFMPEMQVKEHENSYNVRVSAGGSYHCFHGNLVYLPANRGTIEFCDLAATGEGCFNLIHVKRFGASSKLSHLFYQGTNAARLFRTSPEFRKALSKSVTGDVNLAARLLEEPGRLDYRVVFAIASSSSARLELPLFSKLSLRQALRELDGLGFRTLVAQIAIPGEERSLKLIKGTRKTFLKSPSPSDVALS